LMLGLVKKITIARPAFDRDGRWAARGRVSEKLLAELMAHPFLRGRPPKTTGREEFGEAFVQRLLTSARRQRLRPEDMIATATAFTAATIADAYRRFVFPNLTVRERGAVQIILGGGGAKNPTLRRMLAERVGLGEWFTHEDFGIVNAAKEALAFAILTHETLRGEPGNVPSATGARRAVVLGKIVPAYRLQPPRNAGLR
jgi:anhydro-N-acetylmuramic acid kinase